MGPVQEGRRIWGGAAFEMEGPDNSRNTKTFREGQLHTEEKNCLDTV